MNVPTSIDLSRSLRDVLGQASEKASIDADRQRVTADAILERFFAADPAERREIVLLADEVGLGKTFVALAVAVSMLHAIRVQAAPVELPSTKPAVLILTPGNDALFNKWLREAGTFKATCAAENGALDWVQQASSDRAEIKNLVDLTVALRKATLQKPVLAIAKLSVLGAALHEAETWRRRALAVTFQALGIRTDERPRICRKVLGTGAQANVPELLDLRASGSLWEDTERYSSNLQGAYERALRSDRVRERVRRKFDEGADSQMCAVLDDLTRTALAWDWPTLPLVVIDEVHNLKNPKGTTRRDLTLLLEARSKTLLGLSATPFQLRHEELESVLGLRTLLKLPSERRDALANDVDALTSVMKLSREEGDRFRSAWHKLRSRDAPLVDNVWRKMADASKKEWESIAKTAGSRQVEGAMRASVALAKANRDLAAALRPFVIRHRHERGYRKHWVGRNALTASERARGTEHFEWSPGIEVSGAPELAHYLLMRAVSVAKEEKGRAGLGAELTGSYRHLTKTSATWRAFDSPKTPLLQEYRGVLDRLIAGSEADQTHPKVRATVERALESFMSGRKSVIFCVHIQTAEVIRDLLAKRVKAEISERGKGTFGNEREFENFRSRFFNRREALFALIQDQPLLGHAQDGSPGLPLELGLGEIELARVVSLLTEEGESADAEKPDRRLLLAAVEHVALLALEAHPSGASFLDRVLGPHDSPLREAMRSRRWVPRRQPLASQGAPDPEGGRERDPLHVEDAPLEASTRSIPQSGGDWRARLGGDIGAVIAPYFGSSVDLGGSRSVAALLPLHHSGMLSKLDLATRAAAGQVFRRMLMAEEFLVRFLADVPREEGGGRWAEYLAERYAARPEGNHERLRDRFGAYLETLVRAQANPKLLEDYRKAAANRNVVQLVKGGMDRDRYFLGFNTPYRPEILVSTSVGQEGIDLHRECSHVIHHDLCWNPATIEQRTGRVDRIGSKVERERAEKASGDASLDVAVPYLAATYDERMFEELYRRARLFEVTMGGDFRVEGRLSENEVEVQRDAREEQGVGTSDEDLGEEGNDHSGAVALPPEMVAALRVDLSVWKSRSKS